MTQTKPAPQPKLDPREPRRARIQRLNDRFRRTLLGGRIMVTDGVNAMGPIAVAEVLLQVQQFEDFLEDNDPWGEHDFGALSFRGERLFWKIDCYSADLRGHSADAADPEVTVRVLTVMLASEY